MRSPDSDLWLRQVFMHQPTKCIWALKAKGSSFCHIFHSHSLCPKTVMGQWWDWNMTLNFYLRQSYHGSGNFGVIKFSCFKFSCQNIFLVGTTHEKFSLWKHYCEDVPYSSRTCVIRIEPVRLVSTTTITGWNWPIEMISLVLGDAALSSCPPPPLCFARVLQGQRSR